MRPLSGRVPPSLMDHAYVRECVRKGKVTLAKRRTYCASCHAVLTFEGTGGRRQPCDPFGDVRDVYAAFRDHFGWEGPCGPDRNALQYGKGSKGGSDG